MKVKVALVAVLMLAAMSFVADEQKTVVYLVGDSTMSKKSAEAWPETGWGVPFAHFFDSTVMVDNHAQNGRSTRTFITEGRWKKVMSTLKQGDYVFIQFGHNDEVPTKGSYTRPGDFVANLEGFVKDVRSRNAYPVLLTPVSRRSFDVTSAHIIDTHAEYSKLVKSVAAQLQVPFIDLNTKSMALYEGLGEEASRMLFLQLLPGQNPNYANGKEDNTHFNELGARMIAEIVLAEVRKLNLPLSEHIYKGKR